MVLLGRQVLPLRGHRDDCIDISVTQDVNKGNFIALLEHQEITDNILKDHLKSTKKNAKYTSKTIQEEIISVHGEGMKENLTEPFCTGNTKFFL